MSKYWAVEEAAKQAHEKTAFLRRVIERRTERRCGTCRWFCSYKPSDTLAVGDCRWLPDRRPEWMSMAAVTYRTPHEGTDCPTWEARDD